MNRFTAAFGACAMFAYVLCVLLPVCDSQLTQSLGWGSAGSPGKRAADVMASSIQCAYNQDVLDYVMLLIQVKSSFFQ